MIKIEEQEKSAQQFQKMCTERRALLESHISDLQAEVELLRSQIEKKDGMFERIMSHLVLREVE